MKKHITGTIAALAILAPAATPAPAAEPTAVVAHSCSAGYRHATIGGEHKCLHAGQYCARRYQAKYHRKGFHCKASGRLRTR
jgi:hypothetical protein